MTDQPDQHRTSQQVRDTAEFILAIHRFGEISSLAIIDAVGDVYSDNTVIACLSEVARQGELRLRDLIEQTELPGPQLVRAVDRLEALGDVLRRPGPADGDGRAVFIAITPSGIERSAELDRAIFADRDDIAVEVKTAIEYSHRLGGDIMLRDRDESLSFDLVVLGTALGRTTRAISPSGDTSEALALFTLAATAGGTSRPTWISRQVGLTSGGTTKVLDRLERAGHIERSFGLPGDRRGVAVSLTDAGIELLEQMADGMALPARQMLPVLHEIAAHLDLDPA